MAAVGGLLVVNAAHAQGAGAIEAAYQKMAAARTRVETTMTDDKGKVTKSHGEFDTMKRMHVSSDRGEFIMLPDGMWMKIGGEWSKPPIDMSAIMKNFMPLSDDIVRQSKNVLDDGMTTWQGKPAHAWSYDSDIAIMGMHVTAHTKLYLNAAGQAIGSESDGMARGNKTHTVQNITYDDSVRVNAPM